MAIFSYHRRIGQTTAMFRQLSLLVFVWLFLFVNSSTASDPRKGQPSNMPDGLYTFFDDEHAKPIGKWTKPAIEKPDYPTEDFIILDYDKVDNHNLNR